MRESPTFSIKKSKGDKHCIRFFEAKIETWQAKQLNVVADIYEAINDLSWLVYD